MQRTSNFSFDISTPTKKLMTGTSCSSIRKAGSASGQSSIVTRAHRGPINLLWLQEAGDRLKIRVRTTQEVLSPPAFLLGHILPAYMRVIQELMVGVRT